MKKISIDIKLQNNEMSKFLIRHNYSRLGGVFGLILSLAAIVVLIIYYRNFGLQQKISLVALGLMFTCIQPMLLWSKGKSQLKQECFQKPFHYEFTDTNILVTQDDYEQKIDWKGIRKSVCTKDAIYVYTTATAAFIIPKSQCEHQYIQLVKMIQNSRGK